MTETHHLTIGYIPGDCSSERILCGDPETSGTVEISLTIQENEIRSIDDGKKIEVDPKDYFNEKSKLWKNIVKNFCSGFTEKEIKPDMIGACWAIFMDEPSGKKGITELANEEDFGEFENRSGCLNGMFYVRYQLEEDEVDEGDEKYSGEKVLGFY